ncbi:MAG: TPM domain-containing protein [Niabella sp.]
MSTQKTIFFFIIILMTAACNPAKRLNKAVAAKKEQDVKVVFPAQPVATPANINMVYDYENLFTQQQEKKLDSLLRVFEKSNLIPIKLVTITKAQTQGSNFDTNTEQSYKEWDLSHGKSGKGLVITLSKEMDKAKADYGPFVAKFVNKEEMDDIINQQKIKAYSDGDFEATWQGLNQFMDLIRKKIAM